MSQYISISCIDTGLQYNTRRTFPLNLFRKTIPPQTSIYFNINDNDNNDNHDNDNHDDDDKQTKKRKRKRKRK